jgi:hypothetical protein
MQGPSWDDTRPYQSAVMMTAALQKLAHIRCIPNAHSKATDISSILMWQMTVQ